MGVSDHHAIRIDPAVVGLPRRLLIDVLGAIPTYQLQVRLGYAQGWQAAAPLVASAAGRAGLHRQELVAPLLVHLGLGTAVRLASKTKADDPAILLTGSSEADAHRQQCGPATTPVCWFTTGVLTGALSCVSGRAVACLETACAATGADVCTFTVAVVVDGPTVARGDPMADDACAYLVSHLELDTPASPAPDAPPVVADAVGLGTRSPRMRSVLALADRAAQIDSTILLTGESGTGKSRLAKYIHDHSRRAQGRFVAVNCGAIPASLLESELFGHRRGAYTGAIADRIGVFEDAHGGTIFLDEIGELPAEMQVALLSVLQDREVRPVGETRSRPIDVRVMAATNRDLEADVAARRFRMDLYYRLAVVPVHVPPLRDRPDDLHALAERLLATTAQRMQRRIVGYTPRAWDALRGYHWPGNIRELENVIERACAFASRPQIDLADLPEPVRHHAVVDLTPIRPLWEVERDHILAALQHTHGNRAHAARQLHITERTLYRRLQQYEAHPDVPGDD